MVFAQLRAAIVVVPGMHGVDALQAGLSLQRGCQTLGDAVDTAHGGHNPHLVAYAHLAVLAHISVEGEVVVGNVEFFIHRLVFVGQRAREVGLQVVLVHPFAGLEVVHGMSDGVAIFDDVFALGCVVDEHLVPGRCVLCQGDVFSVNVDLFSLVERAQANHYRVCRIDFYE